MEGLRFEAKTDHVFRRIVWLTPFEFSRISATPNQASITENMSVLAEGNAPSLSGILMQLISRVKELSPERARDPDLLDETDQAAFQEALDEALRCKPGKHYLKSVPLSWPGKWMGTQHFSFIPPRLFPIWKQPQFFISENKHILEAALLLLYTHHLYLFG
ncbi:MAG: hypothetical protein AB1797_10990 [bacterium]